MRGEAKAEKVTLGIAVPVKDALADQDVVGRVVGGQRAARREPVLDVGVVVAHQIGGQPGDWVVDMGDAEDAAGLCADVLCERLVADAGGS